MNKCARLTIFLVIDIANELRKIFTFAQGYWTSRLKCLWCLEMRFKIIEVSSVTLSVVWIIIWDTNTEWSFFYSQNTRRIIYFLSEYHIIVNFVSSENITDYCIVFPLNLFQKHDLKDKWDPGEKLPLIR